MHHYHCTFLHIFYEIYAAFNRAVKEAVRRINADKRKYLQYFIDYHGKSDPEVAALSVDDLRESRLIVQEPAPIPDDELERSYNWIRSWGMLEDTALATDLVDAEVRRAVHESAV